MTHCCSQCSFTAHFESALMMHRQLHHQSSVSEDLVKPKLRTDKCNTVPQASPPFSDLKEKRSLKLTGRSSSATRLFEKLRSKVCRSRTLFSHPEESANHHHINDMLVPSECTSKAMKLEAYPSRCSGISLVRDPQKETYRCHLCPFDADRLSDSFTRITVLDRHLLNDHNIGLENLLKLVMAKTKDNLSEDTISPTLFGISQPYYKNVDEVIHEGEFIIETVTPKIKILKHASTNTELEWRSMPDLKNNCKMISEELQKMIKYPLVKGDRNELLDKMQSLNEYMCKFVDSSNTLKKVLSKELGSKHSVRETDEEPYLHLSLGDRDTPREWERPHSEKMERHKGEDNRDEKPKFFSESFYF